MLTRALAILLLCVCLPAGALAQTTKLRVSTNQNIDAAAFEAAKANGYFAEEGLEIDTTPVVGGAVGLPAVAAGQVQIAASNLITIVLGVKNGLPFKIIAAGDASSSAPPDLAGVAAKPESGIKSGKELEGKRLAVNTRNNIIWMFARAWVEATGGDLRKVSFIEVPFPQMVDAIRQGRADAAFIVEPFLSVGLKSKEIEVIGWPYATVLKNAPISQWVASKTYIDQNPQVIDKFVRAYNRGTDWINENNRNEKWVSLISGYTRIAPDIVRTAATPLFVKSMDVGQIEKSIELMRKHGLLQAGDRIDVPGLLYRTVASQK
ncbi:MAG: hypothetical protein GEU95_13485 [Rhizobiales bacterium]|nr:hypothetical protein [Hyphomicrobiales bacterium]